MADTAGSLRGAVLAERLEEAGRALIAVARRVDPADWRRVASAGVWSTGRDAAHVAEATLLHQWMVRRTIGERVPSQRPTIERTELITAMAPTEVAELIRKRTLEGVTLLRGLTDEQLDLPTQPPRGRGELLGRTVERVLIGHYDTHRSEIERKLRRADRAR